jgi:hypothetical protein
MNTKTISNAHRPPAFSLKVLFAFVICSGVALGAYLVFTGQATNPNLIGDVNNDNTVNGADLAILTSHFNTADTTADLNADAKTNILDLSVMMAHWGQSITTGHSIYWGAWMDGSYTYKYYYGDPAPDGQPWTTAPWGNTGNTWDRFEQNTGKKVSVCHYGQPPPWELTTFYGSTANICTGRGANALISMSTKNVPLRDVTAGTYDASIRTWANNVKAWGKPFFLSLDAEMNGTWEPYGPGVNGNTAQDYINMYRHFHDVVVNQGATNVTWVWAPNIGTTQSASVYPLQNYYPGDAYVDWTGFDGYNQNSTYQGFYTIFKSSYDMLLQIAPTKPIAIIEIGSYEYGGQKANWITDMLGTQLPQNFPRIKMFVWFNWRIFEGGISKDWPIESSTSSQAAFRSGISSSYYIQGSLSVVNLPLLSKVPTPP